MWHGRNGIPPCQEDEITAQCRCCSTVGHFGSIRAHLATLIRSFYCFLDQFCHNWLRYISDLIITIFCIFIFTPNAVFVPFIQWGPSIMSEKQANKGGFLVNNGGYMGVSWPPPGGFLEASWERLVFWNTYVTIMKWWGFMGIPSKTSLTVLTEFLLKQHWRSSLYNL